MLLTVLRSTSKGFGVQHCDTLGLGQVGGKGGSVERKSNAQMAGSTYKDSYAQEDSSKQSGQQDKGACKQGNKQETETSKKIATQVNETHTQIEGGSER